MWCSHCAFHFLEIQHCQSSVSSWTPPPQSQSPAEQQQQILYLGKGILYYCIIMLSPLMVFINYYTATSKGICSSHILKGGTQGNPQLLLLTHHSLPQQLGEQYFPSLVTYHHLLVALGGDCHCNPQSLKECMKKGY